MSFARGSLSTPSPMMTLLSQTSATRAAAPELTEHVRNGRGEKRAILMLMYDGDDNNGDAGTGDDIQPRR